MKSSQKIQNKGGIFGNLMGGNQSHRNKIVPVGMILDGNYQTEPINEQENAEAEVIVGNQIIQDGASMGNEIIRASALGNDRIQDSAVNDSVEIA